MTTTLPPYRHPTTLSEVQALVAAQESESLHLEFKASEALVRGKMDEISKDISAFANSDGGVIIYGIVENDHCAERIDEGLSNEDRNHKEWIENKIQSNVAPKLLDLRISEIALSESRFIYAVSVPASDRGPHQDRHTHRYYKRHNFKCAPMEDYEIRDVRNRQIALPPLLSVRIDIVQGQLLQFCVENVGTYSATDVKFQFSERLKWEHGEPKPLSQGIKTLPPKRLLSFFYGVGVWLGTDKIIQDFSVEVSYFHQGEGKRLTETFQMDLQSLLGTLQESTALEQHAQKLEDALGKTTKALDRIAQYISGIENIANPSGMTISHSSLRSLAAIYSRDQTGWPLYEPSQCSWQVFQEVLEIDTNLATKLYQFFTWPNREQKLKAIDGVNEELQAKLQRHFRISPDIFD